MSKTQNAILLVEDAAPLQILMKGILSSLGTIDLAGTGGEAIAKIKNHHWDLILLDLGLPDMDGMTVYEEIRKSLVNKSTDVIFVSGNEDVTVKVMTFHIGAFDYMSKPFHPLELRARCERALRNHGSSSVLDLQSIRLRSDLLVVEVQNHSGKWETHELTVKEFQILRLLADRPGRVWSRGQIVDAIWGENFAVSARVIDTHLSSIRTKIQPYGRCLQCVRGLGYRFQLPSSLSALKRPAA